MAQPSSLPFLLSATVLLVGTGSALAWSHAEYVPGEGLAKGLRIEGEAVPKDADPSAWVKERADSLLARRVKLRLANVPEFEGEASLEELGVRVDVERVVTLARAVGHNGGLAERIHEGLRARRGEIDIPLLVDIDKDALDERLLPIREATDRAPTPARYDFDAKAVIGHEPGHYLDSEGALAAILKAVVSGADIIELPRAELTPRVSSEYVEGIDVGQLIAKFETRFSRAGAQSSRRARNIEVAAARLDGMVLLPNELVSFNAVVGARTVENGFHKAWEIFRGEMVEGVGGGTCQVSSTLYAAAYLAGLDVPVRLPHSRPSAYITMGLDATVVYPIVDLQLRNPFDFPVVVRARVIENTLRFELLGREKLADISFGREVVSSKPFRRRVEEKPGLRDKIVRKQHGIRGYTVKRMRRFVYRDGTERVETDLDHYPPTAEIYQVPPGLDVDSFLPPLLEDGEEGEGRLASNASDRGPKIIDLPAAQAPTQEQKAAPSRVLIRAQ